jgi:hypothetical protein
MPHPLTDMTGRHVGLLTVLERAPVHGKNAHWRCVCACGRETVVSGTRLRRGLTRSCGCLRRDNGLKHGHRRPGATHPLYRVWTTMWQRCSNPRATSYENYGGRGITVCNRWRDFAAFLADMGDRPEWADGGIDRVDNDRGYEPGNCRWATAKEQRANRRRKGS